MQKRKEVSYIGRNIEQRGESQPVLENRSAVVLGGAIISEYGYGLIDAGLAQKYGDEQLIISKAAIHHGIDERDLRVADNEGHWRLIVLKPEIAARIAQRLYQRDS